MINKRCSWADSSTEMTIYHDEEWGFPTYDDQKLFEYFVLEIMQAGLSWSTILKRRAAFKKAFSNFNIEKVAAYGEKDYKRLLLDETIIRNRLKIRAIIENAQLIVKIREKQSFSTYWWHFFDQKTSDNCRQKESDIPGQTLLSQEVSKQLKKVGFKFVGPTIIYSFMQASGVVNDHLLTCPIHQRVKYSIENGEMSNGNSHGKL